MAEIMETPEVMEQPEQTMRPELMEQLQANYLENIQEAELAGNQDMADYYKEQLAKLKEQAGDTGDERLGGWYAGYTPAEWRRWADEEYAKNGNTMKYREYLENAQKAEG